MREDGPVVIAISGLKKSGKSRHIQGVLPLLAQRGLRVAVVKHDGHSFSADVPGTDTHGHLAAGAVGAAVFDGEKFMLTKRLPVTEADLLPFFADADLILLEGFKHGDRPKVEILSRDAGSVCAPPLIGAVGDAALAPPGVPVVAEGDYAGLARLILNFLKR